MTKEIVLMFPWLLLILPLYQVTALIYESHVKMNACGSGQTMFICDPTTPTSTCVATTKYMDCNVDCPNGKDEECRDGLIKCDKCKCVAPANYKKMCMDINVACSLPKTTACRNASQCVLNIWLMDGTSDCNDQSDEDPCFLKRPGCSMLLQQSTLQTMSNAAMKPTAGTVTVPSRAETTAVRVAITPTALSVTPLRAASTPVQPATTARLATTTPVNAATQERTVSTPTRNAITTPKGAAFPPIVVTTPQRGAVTGVAASTAPQIGVTPARAGSTTPLTRAAATMPLVAASTPQALSTTTHFASTQARIVATAPPQIAPTPPRDPIASTAAADTPIHAAAATVQNAVTTPRAASQAQPAPQFTTQQVRVATTAPRSGTTPRPEISPARAASIPLQNIGTPPKLIATSPILAITQSRATDTQPRPISTPQGPPKPAAISTTVKPQVPSAGPISTVKQSITPILPIRMMTSSPVAATLITIAPNVLYAMARMSSLKAASCDTCNCGQPTSPCSNRTMATMPLLSKCSSFFDGAIFGMFQCKNGIGCVHYKLAMDGINDCQDNSDENPLYWNECKLERSQCDMMRARCIDDVDKPPLPSGIATCECLFGYGSNDNGVNCKPL